jgi:apolipoprotein N-acyltransferase
VNNATILAANPYDRPPPLWRRHPEPLIALAVFVLTVIPTVLMFPPYNVGPLAYVFAAPALLWAYRRPSFKLYAWTLLGAQAVAWTLILGWLHHVTWLGLFLLGPFVGVWVGSWFLLARALIHRLPGRSMLVRTFSMLGLAGAWVIIEWTRTWLLSGFPWLSLAASQWEHASILQIASFTGASGVSFVLVAMNIGLAAYGHRLMFESATGLNRRSQEFFAALFLLLVCLSIHVQETFNRVRFNVPFARVGFVQPYVPQDVKWDPARAPEILRILERTTLSLAPRRPDFVLWPEAVTPLAVKGDPTVQAWTENLVKRAGAPLVLGSIGIEANEGGEPSWRNGAFLVEPEEGLAARYYTKRRLVPFGEFVPFRPLLGWLEKVVPVGGDFEQGVDPTLLIMRTRGGVVSAGPLICYEDVFPQLARRSTRAGADVLVVLTNNGWFGEGGAAMQHAAHSVLRAIETRRPVLRCGNGGWSGWIDEFGSVRAVLQKVDFADSSGADRQVVSHRPRDEGSIYFRGATTVDVTRDHRWVGRESFYVRNGDWFVLLSLGLFGLCVTMLRRPLINPPPEDTPATSATDEKGSGGAATEPPCP